MISSYREAYKVAKETDEKLTAYDFKYSALVIVAHEEGSTLSFRSAFLREWRDYILVFTEHHGFHVYHRGDITSYGQYELQPDEKLKNTGHIDKCEFCEKESKVEDLIYDHHPEWDKHDHEYHVYCSDCRDMERNEYKILWKGLNASGMYNTQSKTAEPWGFTWGADNLESVKKACATIMKEELVDKWLDTVSPSFPNTPRKAFEDGEVEEIYLAIYQQASGEFN